MKKIIIKGILLGLMMFVFWNAIGHIAIEIRGLESFADYAQVKPEYRKAEFGW